MHEYWQPLQWLSSQRKAMVDLLVRWVEINSGTDNLLGLQKMFSALRESFEVFGEPIDCISLEPTFQIDIQGRVQKCALGKALRLVKRPEAPIQILLGGHMDTVYPASSPFQLAQLIDDNTLKGPGALDMKGGLIIMLKALEAFERYPQRFSVGWEVIINPDEERGSPGSQQLFRKSALNKDVALIFEPSLTDSAIISARKGSLNFTLISRGVAAHVGRDFARGQNAISTLIKALLKIEQLPLSREGLTINVGRIQGGGPVNIIPDLAIGYCNARLRTLEDGAFLLQALEKIMAEAHPFLELHKDSYRPPKAFDTQHQNLFADLRLCSKELAQDLHWRESGGACDGNILASEGLTTADALGVIGAGIHTFDETIFLDSLVDRAKLCLLFLLKLASHAIEIDRYKK